MRLSRQSVDGRGASSDSWLGVGVTEKCEGVAPGADLQLLSLPDDFKHDHILQQTPSALTQLASHSTTGQACVTCQHSLSTIA